MAYIIYNKKMALYLREKGFRIINTAPNRNKPFFEDFRYLQKSIHRNKPFFDVYFFEDNENLQKEIQIYKSNYIQQEKRNGEKTAFDR